jgi:hypothetical protein
VVPAFQGHAGVSSGFAEFLAAGQEALVEIAFTDKFSGDYVNFCQMAAAGGELTFSMKSEFKKTKNPPGLASPGRVFAYRIWRLPSGLLAGAN